MATYIVLVNWTDQGIRNVKDGAKRLDAAKKALKDLGGEFKAVYLTFGDFDIVTICEAPDDTAIAKFALRMGMLGNVRTKTLKAFSEADYRNIVAALG